jgi:hemolysin activation/secretion protein
VRLKLSQKILACCFGLLICAMQDVWAAPTGAEVPVATFSPGLVGKRLRAPVTPDQQIGTAPVTAHAPHAPNTFPGAEKLKLKLTKVIITGNTVYSTAELLALFRPALNKEIALSDLQNLVYEVTQKYRHDGYILSHAFLPPQRIQNGVVQVEVIEGFVNEVTVTGDPGRVKPLLQAYGAKVAASRPLRLQELERYILLANDLLGTEVRAVLTPSPTTPAASELSLVTDHHAAQGYISYDNYGTRYLGPQQISLGGNVSSLLAAGDSDTARIIVTQRTKQLNFFQFIHAHPLGASGAVLALSGSYTRTMPGFILEPFEVEGLSRTLTADVSYPIIRSRARNFSVHSSFNYENNSSTILEESLYDDHLRTLVVGGSYDFIDGWNGLNSAKLDVEHGFNILGSDNDAGDRSRPQGRSNFTKANLYLSRLQAISSRFSALIAGQGQYAFTPLLASELFTFGGSDFGRGYDPGEIADDKGMAGKAELRMDTQPSLAVLRAVQYYAFYDAGMVWSAGRDGTAGGRASAASTGIGARITFTQHLVGEAFVAQPLTLPVAATVAANENGKQPRYFFQIKALF